MSHRNTARLARWQIWLLTLSGSALWLTGVVWLILHYYGRVQGEFGPEENPVDPWMLRLHGLALIFALLGIGAMFVAHIPKGWPHRSQRVAGIGLSVLLSVLIVSGYMLYYAGGDHLRQWTGVVHWGVGLPLPVVFVWHYVNGLRARSRRRVSKKAVGPQRRRHPPRTATPDPSETPLEADFLSAPEMRKNA